MPDFQTEEITIEPYEYVRECSKSEIRELIEELVDEGHLPYSTLSQIKIGKNGKPSRTSVIHDEFVDGMYSLSEKYHMISKEDEQILEGLFKKYL